MKGLLENGLRTAEPLRRSGGVNRVLSNKGFAETVQTMLEDIVAALPRNGAEPGATQQRQSRRRAHVVGVSPPPSRTLGSDGQLPLAGAADSSSDSDSVAARPGGPASAPFTSSAFLPSLAAGFTAGDSDASDHDDITFEATDGLRKNRRGQRARRAIAERKYGKRAKHLQMKTDPPRASTRPALPSESVHARIPPEAVPPRRQAMQPEHGSWDAKRRERQLADVSLAPQGRKLVFS